MRNQIIIWFQFGTGLAMILVGVVGQYYCAFILLSVCLSFSFVIQPKCHSVKVLALICIWKLLYKRREAKSSSKSEENLQRYQLISVGKTEIFLNVIYKWFKVSMKCHVKTATFKLVNNNSYLSSKSRKRFIIFYNFRKRICKVNAFFFFHFFVSEI